MQQLSLRFCAYRMYVTPEPLLRNTLIFFPNFLLQQSRSPPCACPLCKSVLLCKKSPPPSSSFRGCSRRCCATTAGAFKPPSSTPYVLSRLSVLTYSSLCRFFCLIYIFMKCDVMQKLQQYKAGIRVPSILSSVKTKERLRSIEKEVFVCTYVDVVLYEDLLSRLQLY